MTQVHTGRDNKERQRLFVEVLQDSGELERVEEFVHPEFVDHSAMPGLPASPTTTPR